MIDVIASAVAGMDSATRRFERSAIAVVRSANATAQSDTSRDDDIARNIVDTIEAKTQFKASAALARVSDDMMSNLLDLQARPERER